MATLALTSSTSSGSFPPPVLPLPPFLLPPPPPSFSHLFVYLLISVLVSNFCLAHHPFPHLTCRVTLFSVTYKLILHSFPHSNMSSPGHNFPLTLPRHSECQDFVRPSLQTWVGGGIHCGRYLKLRLMGRHSARERLRKYRAVNRLMGGLSINFQI